MNTLTTEACNQEAIAGMDMRSGPDTGLHRYRAQRKVTHKRAGAAA